MTTQSQSYSYNVNIESVTEQPGLQGGAGWGQSAVTCQPGLEYLTAVDQLLIKQKVELCEVCSGGCCETNNKYAVVNSMGQKVYSAKESTCCCWRFLCDNARPFHIKLKDGSGQEVIHMQRPLRCSHPFCFCCLQKLIVEAPRGSVIGIVRQAWSCCSPKFKLNNADDQTMLRMKGPCCTCNPCGDVEFDVTTEDESQKVGSVTKQWSGLLKEVFTDAENFGVTFPIDLDAKMKATVLGAAFLIDFMFFERTDDQSEESSLWT